MKTNSWREEIEEYFETQSSTKQQRKGRKGSLPEAKFNYMLQQPKKANSSSSNNTTNNHKHRSRRENEEMASSTYSQKNQNAFILEILRTSMFRSKSATDLRNPSTRSSNKSLNKIETGNINKNLINESSYTENSENDFKLSNFYKHSENCTKCLNLKNEQIDSHRGLIWQCADMCYSEFTQKYEELLWLLDGGNFSIQSKLRVFI
jgi:hypothetical protein